MGVGSRVPDKLPLIEGLGFKGLGFRVYLGIRKPTVLRVRPSN